MEGSPQREQTVGGKERTEKGVIEGEVKTDQQVSEWKGDNLWSVNAINRKSVHNWSASESKLVAW